MGARANALRDRALLPAPPHAGLLPVAGPQRAARCWPAPDSTCPPSTAQGSGQWDGAGSVPSIPVPRSVLSPELPGPPGVIVDRLTPPLLCPGSCHVQFPRFFYPPIGPSAGLPRFLGSHCLGQDYWGPRVSPVSRRTLYLAAVNTLSCKTLGARGVLEGFSLNS